MQRRLAIVQDFGTAYLDRVCGPSDPHFVNTRRVVTNTIVLSWERSYLLNFCQDIRTVYTRGSFYVCISEKGRINKYTCLPNNLVMWKGKRSPIDAGLNVVATVGRSVVPYIVCFFFLLILLTTTLFSFYLVP